MKSYNLKRYILVKNGKVFDTSFLFPHVECYFTQDNKLYYESIDGSEFYLGTMIKMSDNLKDIELAKEEND